jgi:hypothetical protein
MLEILANLTSPNCPVHGTLYFRDFNEIMGSLCLDALDGVHTANLW